MDTQVRPSFAQALVAASLTDRVPVICDLKMRSPKEGLLVGARDPVALAVALAEAGAPALSVVTESGQFGGSLDLLSRVAREVSVPVLRKDFIKSRRDIEDTYNAGASAVLLIAAHLSQAELIDLHEEAHRFGLETLIEVHTREELERVTGMQLDVLGINNRDIVQLEMDSGTVANSEALAGQVPPGTVWVSESGIMTPQDVRRAVEAGATAVLVGTAILRADDPVAQLMAFQKAMLPVGRSELGDSA